MGLKRYIIMPVILTQDKTIIPLWDEKVECKKEGGVWVATIKNGSWKNENIITGIFDIKTKGFSLGIDLDHYVKPRFQEGEDVLFETEKYDEWGISKIHKVIYEEYDLNVRKGNKLGPWLEIVKDKGDIKKDCLYCIKEWRPFYQLENGKLIEYEYRLKKLKL
jgi:hypothetical protein